jgi:hypothetical protein
MKLENRRRKYTKPGIIPLAVGVVRDRGPHIAQPIWDKPWIASLPAHTERAAEAGLAREKNSQ